MIRRTFVALLLLTTVAVADDWPQWMGPGRDNVWREKGIMEKFPAGGPKTLWRAKVAGGYAGPAVAGGKVFVTDFVTADNPKVDNFGRKELNGEERVICLNEADGKELWTYKYPVTYSISYPAGPRCTPSVDGGHVYTLGAEGHLGCFDIAKGKVVWFKDLKTEYKTKAALWGYAGHPLIDGDKLITLVGGAGSHIVAFDKKTGKEIWKSLTSKEQGYCPPTILKFAGVRQLIMYRPDAISSLDPDTGKEYWSIPYDASNNSIIMSPIISGTHVYVGGYDKKNMLIALDPQDPHSAKEVWKDKPNLISAINVQPILDGDLIYGLDQSGKMRALAIPEGKVLWETEKAVGGRPKGSETAFLVRHESRYVLFNELGELLFAKLSPTGYEEIDRVKVIEPSNFAFGREVVWSMPAFANRHAYIRNDNEIICVDLAK